jgi:PKD repeat protein
MASVLALVSLVLIPPRLALAVAPTNDNLASATVISSLPFGDVVDNTEATTEPDEPQFCLFSPQTLWYAITPTADAVLRADMGGSSFFDTVITVYQSSGPGFGGLSALRCASFGASVTFSAQAGTTYFLQAGSGFTGGGSLHLNLQAVPPPPNDDIANATLITGLPFDVTVDATAATVEPGEPHDSSCIGPPSATAWYAITPSASGSLTASSPGFSSLAVYTGSPLSGLVSAGCRNFGQLLTFHVDAGVTYHFQLVPLNPLGDGLLRFVVDVTPPPVANFGFQPFDPSIFDTVQFFDFSFDPGGVGFQSQAWDFGDGATGTGCCPTDRYAADGDYTVQLTVTTFDGRTASASQVVQVRTHDVAITKFLAPQAASAEQTRQITVGLNSRRYPETVQVQLFKSVPNGFQFVGTLTQSVPVRSSNRTTDFAFSYTFTSDDASVGKVTFRAVATILGARDPLPADNEAIASPTKVSK